jgi:hypothetical protein
MYKFYLIYQNFLELIELLIILLIVNNIKSRNLKKPFSIKISLKINF